MYFFIFHHRRVSQVTENLKNFFLPRGFDRSVGVLSLVLFINEFGRSVVTVFLPIYLLVDLHATYLAVGFTLALLTGTSAFFQSVGGVLADSWGRKKTMIRSSTIRLSIIISLVGFSFLAPSFLIISLLIIVSEALNGILLTSTNAMVADVVKTGRRVEAYGLYRAASNFGYTLGALFGGMIVFFPEAFLIWSLVALANLLIMFIFVRESNNVVRASFRITSILSASRDRTLLLFALVSVGAGMVGNQMGPTFTLYSTQYIGITKDQVGFLNSLNGIIVTIFQFGFSRLALKHKLSTLMAVSVLIQGTGFLFVGFSPTFVALEAIVVYITIGEMLQAPTGTAFSAAIAPETKRGEYIGFYSWGLNSGSALSPLLGGILLSAFSSSPTNIWYVIFIVGVLCFIAYVFVGKIARSSYPKLTNDL